MTELASNEQLLHYLQSLAGRLRELKQHGLAHAVDSAAGHAAGLSTEFLGESRNTLAVVAKQADRVLEASELASLRTVLSQLDTVLGR